MTQPPPPLPPEEGEVTAGGLASIGQRAGALVIDGLALLTMLAIGLIPFVDVGSFEPGDQLELEPSELAILQAVGVALFALYTVGPVARWGKTPGRFLVGIRVARLADGGNPDLGQSAIRFLLPMTAWLIPAVGPVLTMAVVIRALFHPERRGWHDHAAGTVVLRA